MLCLFSAPIKKVTTIFLWLWAPTLSYLFFLFYLLATVRYREFALIKLSEHDFCQYNTETEMLEKSSLKTEFKNDIYTKFVYNTEPELE